MSTVGQSLNFNEAEPAAPSGSTNVAFQADAPTAPPTTVVRNISAYVTFAYDVAIYFPAVQSSASQEIFRLAFGHTTNYAGNFAGSYGTTKTTATSSATFIVNKNGSQIGTIVFAGGASTPTFTTTAGAAESFAAGDILTIVGPATADATLANWGVTLVGTRTS
jgi:hypothetical protein